MHIAFRVDSSTIIGYGHVMRCLTLAHALSHQFKNTPATMQSIGADEELLITFLCRDHQGHINHLIIDANFNLLTLPTVKQKITPQNSDSWLGTTLEQDVLQCTALLKNLPTIELLIVDHYAIDHRWQTLMKAYYQKILVIDDLANRSHACDYLLDQTFNRSEEAYQALVPDNCLLLLGQSYMLLRNEFSFLITKAKHYRKKRISKYNKNLPAAKILITMGGTDPDNLSHLALHAIEELIEYLPDITVNVVISGQSIHLVLLTAFCDEHLWANLIIDSKNMAELMMSADIAVGASGGTAWERCCLGLPCLTTVNAENQQVIADNLAQSGSTINLGWYQSVTINTMTSSIRDLLSNVKRYEYMVDACFNVCDGKGASNVAKHLISTNEKIYLPITSINTVSLKPAAKEHCELIYGWQSNKSVRKYALNPNTPKWEEHVAWYKACLIDPNRILYLLYDLQKNIVGLLRLDHLLNSKLEKDIAKEIYEISIIISPEYQGKGIATNALNQMKKLHQHATYIATIHEENIGSKKSFDKVGFQQIAPTSYQLNIIDFK